MILSKARAPIFIYLSFILGCFSTFFIIKHTSLGKVAVCCFLSLFFTFLPLPRFLNIKDMHMAFYTGAFIGMSKIPLTILDFFYICLIGTFSYLLLQNYFKEFGGKLGAIAFLSVIFFILIRSIL